MIKREMMKVISSNKIALDTVEMILGNEYISANAKPGQFLHISVPNFTLRRPISIASVDKIEQTVTILFKIIDRKSTRLNSSHVAISYAVFCLKKKRIRLNVVSD